MKQGTDFHRHWSIIQLVWHHADKEHVKLLGAMIFSAVLSLYSSLTLYYVGEFINKVSLRHYDTGLWQYILIIVGILILFTIVKLVNNALLAVVVTNVKRNLEITCLNQLSRIPYDFLLDRANNRITAGITAEVPVVSNLINMIYRSFIRAPLAVVIILILIFSISYQLALILMLFLPLLLLGINYFKKEVKKRVKHTFDNVSHFYNTLSEWISGYKVILASRSEHFMENKLINYSREIAEKSKQSALFSMAQQSLLEFLSIGMISVLLLWISRLLLGDKLLLGDALIIPASIILIRDEMLNLTNGYIQLAKSESAAKRIIELLSLKRGLDGDLRLSQSIHSIQIQNLCYSYPNAENPIFVNANAIFYKGDFNIIVGESGSGKTTFTELCLRFRTPDSGVILFNDCKINDLSDKYLREKTAIVEQEPIIFTDTVKNNLVFAEYVSEEKIWETLEMVNLKSFVLKLPGKLESFIGKGTLNLSAGEKQRLAIARALLKEPELLILDEFSSSLDSDNQERVLHHLLRLKTKMLIICVSHQRFSPTQFNKMFRLSNHGFDLDIQ